MPSRSVLVFPAGMPPSILWARHASEDGVRIVGASSLAHDPARENYREWAWLPWIGDTGFATALGRCLSELRIDAVFTPHPVVWSRLHDLLPTLPHHARLETGPPWEPDLAAYRACREMASRFSREPMELAGWPDAAAPALSSLQLAALVRMFQLVPGQCDYSKLEAVTAIFRRMPRGDVVEIGSLWGRSAVALAFLANHYRIGNLLCVDPWRAEDLLQGIPDVDAIAGMTPLEEIFEAFRINIAPFSGSVNYSRARSEDASVAYGANRCFVTEDFGRVRYAGAIALLHIDGNHALEAVRGDIRWWRRFLRPGGWIVFDDYVWPFGDGPRIAADEFCQANTGWLTAAFVAGGALFVQVNR